MKLKNILLVVKNVEESKRFYKELFGLEVVADFGENVILTEGLVLQEKALWERYIGKKVRTGGHAAELYFEENNLDSFLQKLEKCSFNIEYVHQCMERDWGQRVVRIYDLDRHIIEIGEAMEYVARRYLKQGMTVGQVAKKTKLPLQMIENMVVQ